MKNDVQTKCEKRAASHRGVTVVYDLVEEKLGLFDSCSDFFEEKYDFLTVF